MTKPDMAPHVQEFKHVRLQFEEFGNVKCNFDLDRISILSDDMRIWHTWANELFKETEEALKSTHFNYRKFEQQIFQGFFSKISQAKDISEIAMIFDDLLEYGASTKTTGLYGKSSKMRMLSGAKLRRSIRFVVYRARSHSLVLFPAGMLGPRMMAWEDRFSNSFSLDNANELKLEILKLNHSAIAEKDVILLATIFEHFLSCTIFNKPSDFETDFFEAFWNFYLSQLKSRFNIGSTKDGGSTRFVRTKGLVNRIFSAIVIIAERDEGKIEKANYDIKYYQKSERNRRSTISNTFWWLLEGDGARPDFHEWAKYFSWWTESKPLKMPQSLVGSIKWFLRYLKGLASPPLHPREFDRRYVIRRPDSPDLTLLEMIEKEGLSSRQIGYAVLNDMRRFFEDWHDEFGYDILNWQPPIRVSDYQPPDNKAKTGKEILPVRVIRLLKDIITENDYAWPRSIDRDYCNLYNRSTNEIERVWSPCRAIALLTLLIIPIRSIQLRLIDSGEADEYNFDRSGGAWVKNDHPLALPGRQEGFWRRLRDNVSGRDYVGIHITTNKTAILTSAEAEVGYDIPWECPELVPHIDALVKFQRTFNPVDRKRSRSDLLDATLVPNKATTGLPEFTYLFRDPSNVFAPPSEPVAYGPLANFLYAALQEAERRLSAGGEKITLVTLNKQGSPSSIYSLHGLRAAGITHFIQAGVPIQVIAEFVAGHATILMTLHYTKLGPAYITDVLDRAHAVMEDGLEDDFTHFLHDASPDRRKTLVVSNSEAGFKKLADSSPGIWSVGIDGICPTGRTMCDEGGKQVTSNKNAYFAPVPGGPRNCAQCRFFITGPAFLNGQVIAFNNLVFALGEKAADLRRMQNKVAELMIAGKSSKEVERQKNHVVALEVEIELMLATLQARAQLIEQSRLLLSDLSTASEGHAERQQLITKMATQEDLEIVLEHTSDFDLVEFVAQACELFPEKAEPSARLRKGKILDQFLKRNGYEAFFYQLSDDEALAAGNRLTRFLQEKVGRDRVRSLMDGHESLISLGIVREFERQAEPVLGARRLQISLSGKDVDG